MSLTRKQTEARAAAQGPPLELLDYQGRWYARTPARSLPDVRKSVVVADEACINAADFISIIKLKARQQLNSTGG
jgi:hypothetical protein